MLALVRDPEAPSGLRRAEVAEPVPRPDEALIAVAHASANFGDLRYLAHREPGTTLGYDAAGIVVAAAADGSGPAAGTRVVGFGPGAWAQRVAIATVDLAEVPSEVDLATAAALPMAGMTALRNLRAAGPLLGRRVLITGASGGVGRFAVQLARRAGAHVIASVGSPARADGLARLGAHEVVVGLADLDPVDVVLETVGGAHLVAAWSLLRPGGSLHSIGWAGGEPAVFPVNSTFSPGPARTLHSFGDATNVGPDLAILLELVRAGELSPEIGWRGSWDHLADAAAELFARRVPGKIVIDIPPDAG